MSIKCILKKCQNSTGRDLEGCDTSRVNLSTAQDLIKRAYELGKSENSINDDLKKKISSLMYALTKTAAREDFVEFLDCEGLTLNDYEDIKRFWESVGITGTYL